MNNLYDGVVVRYKKCYASSFRYKCMLNRLCLFLQPPNNLVQYYFASSTPSDLFLIDSRTGDVTIRKDLTTEDTKTYNVVFQNNLYCLVSKLFLKRLGWENINHFFLIIVQGSGFRLGIPTKDQPRNTIDYQCSKKRLWSIVWELAKQCDNPSRCWVELYCVLCKLHWCRHCGKNTLFMLSYFA